MNNKQNKPYVEKRSVIFSQACRQFLSFSLRIVEYGSVSTMTNDLDGERFVHHHRLNYITEGHPYYIEGNEKIELEPGYLVYMPPNTSLIFDETTDCLKLYFINFELGSLNARDEFYQFINNLFPNRHVHDKDDELKQIFEEIFKIGRKDQLGAALEIQNLFENLFLHVVRMSRRYHAPQEGERAIGSDTILENAMNYINSNLHHNFRISDMAETLNISENYLYKIFIRQTGKSPTNFIKDLRIDLAKSSLANPNLSVKIIAANLGYQSVSHFSSAFKKATGKSPSAYRKSILCIPPFIPHP